MTNPILHESKRVKSFNRGCLIGTWLFLTACSILLGTRWGEIKGRNLFLAPFSGPFTMLPHSWSEGSNYWVITSAFTLLLLLITILVWASNRTLLVVMFVMGSIATGLLGVLWTWAQVME